MILAVIGSQQMYSHTPFLSWLMILAVIGSQQMCSQTPCLSWSVMCPATALYVGCGQSLHNDSGRADLKASA
ncbi:hypothetical protein V8C42DRAFT_293892 [Trichoderma barbatum]